MSPVKNGPSCPGCGLTNYQGLCPVCRGDEAATRNEDLPFPWPNEDPDEKRERQLIDEREGFR